MSLQSNARAAQRRIKIPNPLKAIDNTWKAAAGPTQWPAKPNPNAPARDLVIPGGRPRKRRGAGGYSKGGGPD